MLAAAVLSGSRYSLDTSKSVGSAFGQAVGHLATGTPPAYTGPLPLPLWLTALLQIPLWACLLGVPVIATSSRATARWRDLGLRVRAIDVPLGLAIGVASQVVLVPLVYVPIFKLFGHQDVSAVARQLTDRATDPFGVIAAVRHRRHRGADRRGDLLPGPDPAVGRAAGSGPLVALVGTAAFFAVTHFELVQFPALFALRAGAGRAGLPDRAARHGDLRPPRVQPRGRRRPWCGASRLPGG